MTEHQNSGTDPEQTKRGRNAHQLIEEFKETASGAFYAAIVVGFEKETKFIAHNEPDQLKTLMTLMRQGGQPIGVVRLDKKGKTIDTSIRIFKEWEGQEWVNEYVDALGRTMLAPLISAKGGEVVGIERNLPGLN